MQLPPLPQIPLDLDTDNRQFLESLDGRLDRILVARKEGDKLHVMGKKGRGSVYFEGERVVVSYPQGGLNYVTLERDTSSGEVQESSSLDVWSWSNKEKKLAWSTLGIGYAIWWTYFSKERKQRVEAEDNFKNKASHYYQQNLDDIRQKVKHIPVLQSPLSEAESRLGQKLDFVETGSADTFIHASELLWLRAKAYLLGADAIVHYQPGSAIGTPVKFKNR